MRTRYTVTFLLGLIFGTQNVLKATNAEILLVKSQQLYCDCTSSSNLVYKVLRQEGKNLFMKNDVTYLDWHYKREYVIKRSEVIPKYVFTGTVELMPNNDYKYEFKLIELNNFNVKSNPLFTAIISKQAEVGDIQYILSPIIKEVEHFILNGRFKIHLEVHEFGGEVRSNDQDDIEEIIDKLTRKLNKSEIKDLYNFIIDDETLNLKDWLKGTYRNSTKLKLKISIPKKEVAYCRPYRFDFDGDIDKQVNELARIVVQKIKSL